MNEVKKYQCPCCGNYTISEKPPGTYEICPVCYWEDDDVQYSDPGFEGGANDMSLNEAREKYLKIGAIGSEFLSKVRKPLEVEKGKRCK